MARSRYVQQKSDVNQALRAVRRLYRLADTQGERLERTLDRLILRKTQVYDDQILVAVNQYRDYRSKVDAVEGAFTQAITIAGQ